MHTIKIGDIFALTIILFCISIPLNTPSQYLWLTEHLQTKYYHLIPEVNDWKPVYGYCALLMTMNARSTYFQLVTISSFTYRTEYVWIIKNSHGVVDNNIFGSNLTRNIFIMHVLKMFNFYPRKSIKTAPWWSFILMGYFKGCF